MGIETIPTRESDEKKARELADKEEFSRMQDIASDEVPDRDAIIKLKEELAKPDLIDSEKAQLEEDIKNLEGSIQQTDAAADQKYLAKTKRQSLQGLGDQLSYYKEMALKEMEDDIYQRITEATSADEIEKLNNELKKTRESITTDNANIKELTPQEQKQYEQYKTDDAKKAVFVKNGVTNKVIEGAAQENLNKATHELDEVGFKVADLQTEKNQQASKHNSEAISKITAQLKDLEKNQADLAQNQWEADWDINENNEAKKKFASIEDSRVLSDAEFLKGSTEYDKEKGDRLELTNEQIEATRDEMGKNLEERMKANQPSILSPEEIAKIGKERKLLEAELIKHGAKYIIGENGEKQLVLTKDQIRQVSNEMKKSLEIATKENTDKKVKNNHSEIETIKKETQGKNSDNKSTESKAGKATKRELPGWLKILLEGISGIALIAFSALFGSLEKQVGKKKGK